MSSDRGDLEEDELKLYCGETNLVIDRLGREVVRRRAAHAKLIALVAELEGWSGNPSTHGYIGPHIAGLIRARLSGG